MSGRQLQLLITLLLIFILTVICTSKPLCISKVTAVFHKPQMNGFKCRWGGAGGGLSPAVRGQAACQAQREEEPRGSSFVQMSKCRSATQSLCWVCSLAHVPVTCGLVRGGRHLSSQVCVWHLCMPGTLTCLSATDTAESKRKSLTSRSFQLVGVRGYPETE